LVTPSISFYTCPIATCLQLTNRDLRVADLGWNWCQGGVVVESPSLTPDEVTAWSGELDTDLIERTIFTSTPCFDQIFISTSTTAIRGCWGTVPSRERVRVNFVGFDVLPGCVLNFYFCNGVNRECLQTQTFSKTLLEYPEYVKPISQTQISRASSLTTVVAQCIFTPEWS